MKQKLTKSLSSTASFEAFTAVKIQVEVFWVVTPCSVVAGWQRFGGPCCRHLQGEVRVIVPWSLHLSRKDREVRNFKDVDVSKSEWVRNPCAASYISRLTICEQEQLTDISCDGSPKDMFDADKLVQFLLLVTNDYPSLSREVVKVLLHFVTTDLCETGFSAVAIMNTKYLSQLITENELGVAILSVAPRFG